MAMAFTGRVEVVWLLAGEMVYAYLLVLRLRKGLPRMLALIPVVPPSFLVPWRAKTAPERVLYSFLFLWMIMFKLLLLAWDTGPAADPYALSSFPRFFTAMTLSLHMQRDERFVKGKEKPAVHTDSSKAVEGKRSSDSNGLVRRKIGADAGREESQASGGQVENVPQGTADGKAHSTLISRWLSKLTTSQAGPIVILRSVYFFLATASLLHIVMAWKHRMSVYALDFILGFFLYFSFLFVFEGVAGPTACLLGSQLQPQFNLPFMADSIADFWGRRWNLLVNNMLRVSVYEPMLRFICGDKKPAPRDRVICVLAAFLLSGLMHELIFFYLNQSRPTWEMTAFFVVNGVATVVEGILLPRRRRVLVPRLVRRAYTLTFLYLSACWLFFPPLLRTGMVDQCLADLEVFVAWIQRKVLLKG